MPRPCLTVALILCTIYISAVEVSASGCYVKSLSECNCKTPQADCGAADEWTERCLCPYDNTTFGKDIYYDKVNEQGLLTSCTHDYCLDRKTSRGSCYYMGRHAQVNPYVGHSVFCDVSEEECCGYVGCSSNDGYYWYAAGYVSKGRSTGLATCCHCMASCDHSKEQEEACSYYDVTTSDCQRNSTHDSADTIGDVKMFGRHTCEVPNNIRESDMYVRYPPPVTSGASGVKAAARNYALSAAVGAFAMHPSNNRQTSVLCALYVAFVFVLLQAPIVTAQNSTPSDAELARYLVHENTYSIVATNSIHLDGHVFSNVASCSDGIGDNSTGRIFFYLTLMDPTGADLKKDLSAAVTFAQAQLTGASSCGMMDPEDPTCAKLTIGGNIIEVQEGTDKEFALKALFSRNPAMSEWPAEHGWIVFEMKPEDIIIFSHYGGSARISPLEYFAASPKSPTNIVRTRQAAVQKSQMASSLSRPAIPSVTKPEAARTMIHAATWGVLSASTKAGKPFSYVESFSDGATGLATGRIWFFLTEKDQVVDDAARDDRVSFTVSQAMIDVARASDPFCGGNIAEDPTCGRITLSGRLRPLNSPAEISTAKAALFARHPVMASWPGTHAFTPYELEIETIFFVNFYGGASPMTVSEYFAAFPMSENVSENTVTVAK